MGGRVTYPVYKWTRHIEKCKTREPAYVSVILSRTFPVCADNTFSSGSDGNESADDQAFVAPTPERTPRRNEEQRREFLNNDPRALVVKEWEVQCRACQKWIKLGNQRKYDLTPWNLHCGRCSGELCVRSCAYNDHLAQLTLSHRPSGRVATMNRRLQLLNDLQVKSFTAEAVVCDACKLPVVLQGDGDYNLVKWHEHKLTCILPPLPPVPIPSISAIENIPKPPTSNADTEATLVGTSSSPPRGKKRQREDEDDTQGPAGTTTEGLDTRPTIKRRTESYEPPKGFLPSLWRWATTEVKAFVRAAFGSGEETSGEAGEDRNAASKA